jgi:uncharacterized protein DUF3224
MYRRDGSATFVGLERIVGQLGGKTGTFVLQRTGVFEGGQAKESYSVIQGSATGETSRLHPAKTRWRAALTSPPQLIRPRSVHRREALGDERAVAATGVGA